MVTNNGEVKIFGAQEVGGRISVRFESDGEEKVAANSGDYIYPSDVRYDRELNRLYVRTSGRPPAFGGDQTWLFEYDLQRRRRTDRKRAEPSALVALCEHR